MEESPWKTLAPADIRTSDSWTRFLVTRHTTLSWLLSNSKAFITFLFKELVLYNFIWILFFERVQCQHLETLHFVTTEYWIKQIEILNTLINFKPKNKINIQLQ